MSLRTVAFIAAALALPLDGVAQLAFIARCDPPVGTRFEQVDGEVRQQAEGVPDINPTFIVRSEAPRRLTFLWGPAAWARDSQKLVENLQDAEIVESSPEKITAVRIEAPGVAKVYSLYPKRGLLYFTQHRTTEASPDSAPAATTYYAKCEFAS